VTIPINTNLTPISRNPSVKEFMTKSIKTNDNPNKKTSIPIVTNALNSGDEFPIEILFHHHNIRGITVK